MWNGVQRCMSVSGCDELQWNRACHGKTTLDSASTDSLHSSAAQSIAICMYGLSCNRHLCCWMASIREVIYCAAMLELETASNSIFWFQAAANMILEAVER